MEAADDELRAVIRGMEKATQRIQGFLYGERRVIRDVYKSEGAQILYECPAHDCTDPEFIERCQMERLRLVLRTVFADKQI